MEPVALRKTMPDLGSVGRLVVLRPGRAVDSRAVPLRPGRTAVATTTTMVVAATEAGRQVAEYHRGNRVAAVVAVATVVATEVADTVAAAAEVPRPGNSSHRLPGTAMVVVNSNSSLPGPCLLLPLLHLATTYRRRLLRVMSRLLLRRRPRRAVRRSLSFWKGTYLCNCWGLLTCRSKYCDTGPKSS